ncbi:hypothetical protein QTO34_010576 [Cnephaeus nilssonii]|uniref:Uncharacterized protein n=1 Tax=Cnephaeus nilssonii TaxID=3371016 RepID=A0AA40HGG5_CNENI|nr:hypothetical protein QTO34_010576 [Eptesicus nilssonii]
MTQEERDDSLRFNENITFGQLGTFTHNMLAFGLNKKLCNDFLKKQAVIGNLDEGFWEGPRDHTLCYRSHEAKEPTSRCTSTPGPQRAGGEGCVASSSLHSPSLMRS